MSAIDAMLVMKSLQELHNMMETREGAIFSEVSNEEIFKREIVKMCVEIVTAMYTTNPKTRDHGLALLQAVYTNNPPNLVVKH